MLGPSPDKGQTDLFKNLISYLLNPQHPLSLCARVLPWTKLAEASALWAGELVEPPH
jgi:hypothetical protein